MTEISNFAAPIAANSASRVNLEKRFRRQSPHIVQHDIDSTFDCCPEVVHQIAFLSRESNERVSTQSADFLFGTGTARGGDHSGRTQMPGNLDSESTGGTRRADHKHRFTR